MLSIRQAEPNDIHALYRICLQTADNGDDASAGYADPLLLGHHYVGPYLAFEPNLCFVLTDDVTTNLKSQRDTVVGYILGTSNSGAFGLFSEQQWSPPIRNRYPLPANDDTSADASIIRAIHRGHDRQLSENYPAHLHIDILAPARNQGFGKKLMHSFFGRLRKIQVSGVKLRVGPENTNAIGFYQNLGFKPADSNSSYIEMTLSMNETELGND